MVLGLGFGVQGSELRAKVDAAGRKGQYHPPFESDTTNQIEGALSNEIFVFSLFHFGVWYHFGAESTVHFELYFEPVLECLAQYRAQALVVRAPW